MIRLFCFAAAAHCALCACNMFAAPIATPAAEQETETPERSRPPEIREAIELFEQGDAGAAFQQLQSASAAHSHLPPPRVMLANLYFTSGDVAAGRLALEQAAVESPNDPEVYLILADLLLRERRWTEAGALFAQGESLWRQYSANDGRKRLLEARLCAGQATVAEARAQWDDAAKLLGRWLKLDPKSLAAQQRIGRALFMLKHEKEAFAAFEAATRIADTAPPAPVAMAMLFQQQGNAAKAAEWIQFALQKDPQGFTTQFGAAQWNWEAGRLDEVAKHAAAAIQLQPDSLDAQLLAAQAAYFRNEQRDAEARLEKLQQQSPGNFVVANLLAWSLSASDDPTKQQRAVELAGLNSERFPDSAEAAATVGYALFRAGHSKEALAQLTRIKANATLSRDAAYRVARVLYESNQRDQAVELLQGALESPGLFAAEAEARAWQASLARGEKADSK